MSITFPRYSFVQSSNPDTGDCYDDPSVCLPLSDRAHLKFTCEMVSSDIDWLLGQYDSSTDSLLLYAAVVQTDFICTPAQLDYTTISGLRPYFNHYQRFILAEYSVSSFSPAHMTAFFGFTSGANDFGDLTVEDNTWVPEIGQCFKLCFFFEILRIVEGDQSIPYRIQMGCTGCFRRIAADSCYTSVLTYSNPDDTFDFTYQISTGTSAIATINTVELPIYLRDPVMNDDTKVYTRSDGSIVKLYERKEEQYTLETDLMPYTWLKALDIALSHDTVSIISTNAAAYDSINTAQNFQKKENFEIEYQKGPLTALGKGTCKLLNANPVHLYNNNCG